MAFRTGIASLRGEGRGWTLLAIALGWVFVVGGRYLVPAVLPQVKSTFGVSDFAAGVAITILWIGYALMQAPGGLLIDRLGERTLLAGSLVLTAASTFLVGIAPVFVAFAVGCGAFGLASGLYGPARGTALSRTFPDSDGTAIGVTLAAGSAGSAILPFVAGALVGAVSWRLLLGGLLAPLALAGLLVWRTVPPTGGGAAGVTPRKLAGDVLRAVRVTGVGSAFAGVTLMVFVFQAVTAFLVTYMVSIKELDQAVAAGALSLFFVGAAVSQILAGAVADRVGDRPVLIWISLCNVPFLLAVPYVDGTAPLLVLSALLGSQQGVGPVSNAYLIGILPEDVTGSAWGVIRVGMFLFPATGSTVVGAMADADLFDESFLVLAGLVVLAVLTYARIPDRATVDVG